MALAPSSPRLPSPPPAAEIQLGPKSPSSGATVSLQATQVEQTVLDANSQRRIHPGTKAADMAAGPPLIPLNEAWRTHPRPRESPQADEPRQLDSAFQLQEHLAALHYHHTALGTQALTRTTSVHLAQPPAGIDRTLWLYELCRFLISKCNSLIVGFLFDTPPCSANTCPEMRASEWQFLCAVHEQPKSCCAIDYCCHTLDWAANVVSDQKIFPSRFVVLNDAHSRNFGVKNLVNVFRRLHRIFAHAWFQHRSVFWTVEGQTGLYVFFKTVCDLYDLLPAENYKLPPEAEGLEAPPPEPEAERPPPTILKPQRDMGGEDDGSHPAARTNTRRHIRSSPSTGSAVTTVVEADEEEADSDSNKLHVSAPPPPPPPPTGDDEPEMADVPVIVEQSVLKTAPPQPASAPQFEPGLEDLRESSNVAQSDVVEVHPDQEQTKEDSDESNQPATSEETTADDAAQLSESREHESPHEPVPATKEVEVSSESAKSPIGETPGGQGSDLADTTPEEKGALESAVGDL